MRRTMLALMVAALTAVLVVGVAPGPASARPRPHKQFVVDDAGHVLITHGINMVYKRPPYRPDAIGFGADDAAFLHRNGFTSVRLGVIWKAVEPTPGHFDDSYLRHLRSTVRILHRHGIRALLDFHQDLFNERFQGEGAPDWAVLDDGVPNEPQAGFPGNYFANAALNRAFDNFWSDAPGPGGVGLIERYAAAWRHVAAFMRHTPGVLGIDVFNEPWPGSSYASCIPAGCTIFDQQLQHMTQAVIDAVRTVDKQTAIFYEPSVLFSSGVQTSVAPVGRRLGFSFHDYCVSTSTGPTSVLTNPGCTTLDNRVWSNEVQRTAATGATPLLTEFGATKDRGVITDMIDRAARHRTGWMYWAYCGCDDPTTTGAGAEQALVLNPAKAPKGHNVEWAKLRALAVPYPASTAGTPTAYHFGSGVFTATWSTKRYAGPGRFGRGARTRIAVPRIEYPHGYRVRVRGGRVVSARNAGWLVVAQRAGVSQMHVRVSPR